MVAVEFSEINVSAVTKKTFPKLTDIATQSSNRNAIGMVISHVGDLLISGNGDSISFLPGESAREFGFNFFCGFGSIY